MLVVLAQEKNKAKMGYKVPKDQLEFRYDQHKVPRTITEEGLNGENEATGVSGRTWWLVLKPLRQAWAYPVQNQEEAITAEWKKRRGNCREARESTYVLQHSLAVIKREAH